MQHWSRERIVDAIEANLFGFLSSFEDWSAAELHDDQDLLWSLTDIPFPFFNSVLRARINEDLVSSRIDTVLAHARSNQVPLLWWTGPGTQPADLGQILQGRGFKHDADYPGMACDLLNLPLPAAVPGLSILKVTNNGHLRQWTKACVDGFELPEFVGDAFYDWYSQLGLEGQRPLHHYLGFLNNKPVAASSLFLHSGVAGIYNVAVVPDARRKGIGAHMTWQPLRDACQAGFELGILHASKMAESVYQGLGFRSYCLIGHYLADT